MIECARVEPLDEIFEVIGGDGGEGKIVEVRIASTGRV